MQYSERRRGDLLPEKRVLERRRALLELNQLRLQHATCHVGARRKSQGLSATVQVCSAVAIAIGGWGARATV